jgi:hypothetical protein
MCKLNDAQRALKRREEGKKMFADMGFQAINL